jgi:hypothetical protein
LFFYIVYSLHPHPSMEESNYMGEG